MDVLPTLIIILILNVFLLYKIKLYIKILFCNLIAVNDENIREKIDKNILITYSNKNLIEFRYASYFLFPLLILSMFVISYITYLSYINQHPNPISLTIMIIIITSAISINSLKLTKPLWLLNWSQLLQTFRIQIDNDIVRKQLQQIKIDIQKENITQQEIDFLNLKTIILTQQADFLKQEINDNIQLSNQLNKFNDQ